MIQDANNMCNNILHPEDGSVRKNSFAEIKSKSEPVTPIQGIQGSYEQIKQPTNTESENKHTPPFVPSTHQYPYPYPGTPSYPYGYQYPFYPMGYQPNMNPYYFFPPPPHLYYPPPPPTPVQPHSTPSTSSGPTLQESDNQSVSSYSTTPISTVTLNRVSDPSEFHEFLTNFQKYLNDINLSKIFINTAQSTITDQEKQHVTHIFRLYVDPKAYPMWFKNELSDNYVSFFDLIQCAIIKHNKRNTPTKLYQQLQHIRYDPKYDPMLFKKRINNMIQQAKQYDLVIPDRILCDTIIQSLHGPYQIIVDNYNRNFQHITLNDILNDIINIHSRQPHSYPTKHHTNTSSPIKPQPPPSSSAKPTTSTKKTPRKIQISNIYLGPQISENLETDSPDNLKDYLVLDTGAEISVINDKNFLTNTTDANVILTAVNDEPIPATTSGIISLKFQSHSKPYVIQAIHAPDISHNFISTYQLEQAGIVVDTRHRQLLDKSEHILSPIIDVGKYMCIPRSILHAFNTENTSNIASAHTPLSSTDSSIVSQSSSYHHVSSPSAYNSPSTTAALPSQEPSFHDPYANNSQKAENIINSIINEDSIFENDVGSLESDISDSSDFTSSSPPNHITTTLVDTSPFPNTCNPSSLSTSPTQTTPAPNNKLSGTITPDSSRSPNDSSIFANTPKNTVLGGTNPDAEITTPSSEKNTDASQLAKNAKEYLKKFSKEYQINNIKASQRSNESNHTSHSISYQDAITKYTNNESKHLFNLAYDKELNQLRKLGTCDKELTDDIVTTTIGTKSQPAMAVINSKEDKPTTYNRYKKLTSTWIV